jgi:hypothetical protein
MSLWTIFQVAHRIMHAIRATSMIDLKGIQVSYPTPEQPGHGAPRYPYGTPDQSYTAVPGQPYSAPPPPYDMPMAPYGPLGMPPMRQSNGVATAAIIFAFIMPLVGFILGIVGVSKSGNAGGKGKGLSIAAIIISILIPIITFVGIVAALGGTTKVAERLNPGCLSAVGTSRTWANNLKADGSDLTAIKADTRTAITELNNDAAKSTNPTAKAAILKVSADIQQLLDDLNSHTQPSTALHARLTTDADALDAACGR